MYYDPSGYYICPASKANNLYSKKQFTNGYDWNEAFKKKYGQKDVTWYNTIEEFDIRPYGEFNKPRYANDNLTGHELLQNAWLEANGKITKRGTGLSLENPAIALRENPMHKFISGRQRTLQLNKKNLVGVSWRKNVLDNIQILKEAGVPRHKIAELARQTRAFAIKNGF